jgi:hypothetical protein
MKVAKRRVKQFNISVADGEGSFGGMNNGIGAKNFLRK